MRRSFISCPLCNLKSCDVVVDFSYCTKCNYNSTQHGMPPITFKHQVSTKNGRSIEINLESIKKIQDNLNGKPSKQQRES